MTSTGGAVMKKTMKIAIHGREYPCMMTLGALRRFKRETGYDVSRLANDDIDGMITLLWCCTASACNDGEVAFDMSLDDFADALAPGDMEGFVKAVSEGAPDPKKKTVRK